MIVQKNNITEHQRLHYDWVDHAKAMGIVLVVLGHTQSLPREVFYFVYRFHMPLFFFLSGYLINTQRLFSDPVKWARRVSVSVMVPYLGWWFVSFLWWLIIRQFGEEAAESAVLPWWQPLWGLIWGTGAELWVNVPLWFFPSLLVTSACGALILYWAKANRRWLVGMGLLTTVLTLVWPALPISGWWFNLDLLPWTLFFYLNGHMFHWWEEFFRRMKWWWKGMLGLVSVTLCWLCVKLGQAHNPYVGLANLNERSFDPLPILYFLPALLMIWSVFLIADCMPRVRLSSLLAKESIIIFPAHSLCSSLFTGICNVVLGVRGWNTGGGWPSVLAYTAIGLIIPVATSPIIRKYLPLLTGFRK